MLAIGNKALTAFGLVGFLVFTAGCKEDPCATKIEETVTLQTVKGGSGNLLLSVDKLDFLADSTVVWDDIELELTVSGKHTLDENIVLSFNGFKFNRKDGHRAMEGMSYTSKKNSSAGVFKLHKMYLNGAEPFHMFLARIKKNKGNLQVKVFGKKLDITSAKMTFKGSSFKKCPSPSPTPGSTPTPTPTATPTPVPVAPDTTLDSMDPAKSPTASTSISFNFSSSTEGNTFWCSLDGAAEEKCSSPQSYSNLLAGTHSFSVYAQSPQGLKDATPATYSWKVDNVAPSATIDNSADLATLTSSRAISFNFSASKDGSTFKCSLDGATSVGCTSPQSYGALGEGPHTFSVNATDALGNVGKTPATFRWTVDATAPTASFIDISPADAISNVTSRAFTFTADESADFECSLDDSAFAVCQSPSMVSNLAEGNHLFKVRATDAAGNQGLEVSYSWAIDVTAPQVITGIVSPLPGITNSKNISVEIGTNEAASLFCSLDGAGTIPCTSPYSAQDLSEGDHSLDIYAMDVAGNMSAPLSMQWTMDFTAPTVSFGDILPSASSFINSDSVQIGVNAPQGATLYASVNGGAWAPSGNVIQFSGLAEGNYAVAVYASDAAGNASTPIVHNFAVDLTAPGVSITASVVQNPTNVDHNSFAFAASEEATFECSLDGAGFEACVSPKDVSGLADGAHSFQMHAIDRAGNVSSAAVYSWVVDTKPPVTSVSATIVDDSATFSMTADEMNAVFSCSLDGVPVTPCSSVMSYKGLAIGNHSFLAKAIDIAGNVDPVGATYQFVITKPIKTTITSATPSGSPTSLGTMTITFVADQAGATFKCSLDNAALTACTSPMSYSGIADGTHKFVVKAIDAFGNMDPTGASYAWAVDNTAPVVTSFTLSATTTSVTVTWTTNEPSSAQVFFGVGTALNQATAEVSDNSTTHSIKLTGLSANTTYSVQVGGRDLVGNVYRSATKTVKTSR